MILNYVFITPSSNLLNFTLKENTQLGARGTAQAQCMPGMCEGLGLIYSDGKKKNLSVTCEKEWTALLYLHLTQVQQSLKYIFLTVRIQQP